MWHTHLGKKPMTFNLRIKSYGNGIFLPLSHLNDNIGQEMSCSIGVIVLEIDQKTQA